MSDFYRTPTSPRASKRYVCIACGWFIPVGEQHKAQTGVFEGLAFSNRFHDECFEATALDGADDEFTTGDYPVPDRFKAEVAEHEKARRASMTAAGGGEKSHD